MVKSIQGMGSKKSDYLRSQEHPTVLGHELNRQTLTPIRTAINTSKKGDYGADPLGGGKFKMVPSGDIVDYAERCRRLGQGKDSTQDRRTRLHRALDCVLDRKSAKDTVEDVIRFREINHLLAKMGEYSKLPPSRRKEYSDLYTERETLVRKMQKEDPAKDVQGSGARLTQINKEYNRLSAQQSKLNAKMIEEGHGHVRMSELHSLNSPTATEYLRLGEAMAKLSAEGERIYGPGFRPGSSTYYKPGSMRAR